MKKLVVENGVRYTVEVVSNSNTFWYKEGTTILHREGGPACEYADGDKSWWKEGKCHREDGPAYEGANGSKGWWLNGKEYSESNYNEEMKRRGITIKATSNKTSSNMDKDLSDWRMWAHNRSGECPCGIVRKDCSYHNS